VTQELARRVAFTIGALLLFRLGTYIPLPGIDPETWEHFFGTQAGGILGMFNQFAAGGIHRMSIFALGIHPYLSAAIIIRLLSLVWPGVGSLDRSGEAGRRRVAHYTLILTLLMAGLQAYGMAMGLQGAGGNLVSDPGPFFLLSTTITLTGGAFFLVWLSEQVTRHGIGNGLALILIFGVVVELPRGLVTMLELGRQGAAPDNLTLKILLAAGAVIVLVVFLESARRDIRVEFAERKVGERVLPARSSVLSIKINSAGVLMPAMMTVWTYWVLKWAGHFLNDSHPWLGAAIANHHLLLQVILVFVFCFVYAAYVVDPDHAAESLHKRGGVIPGIEPGELTANYLDRVISSMTVIGAIYLTAVWLFPAVLIANFNVPFYFSGETTMIVVCTVLDIRTQVRDLLRINAGEKRQ